METLTTLSTGKFHPAGPITTNIQLLRSGIAYKRPSAAPLLDGQAAINFNSAEPGLFFRLTNGQLAKVGPVAITDNGMQPNAGPAGETGNSVGETWLDAHPALHAPILHVYNGTEFLPANGFTVNKATGDLTLLRQLEVTKLVAGSAEINGTLDVAGNITPNNQNCAFFLGLPNERWDVFYGCNFDITFDGTVGRDLTVNQDTVLNRDVEIGRHVKSNLTPDTNVTRSLGDATHRWETYAAGLNASGNTFLGVADALCATTLTVHSASTFHCPVEFIQPIEISQIGNNCSDTLAIKATTTFDCPVSIDTIGSGCGDTLAVNATSTFSCPVTFTNQVAMDGHVTIGNNCTDNLDVTAETVFNCAVTFKDTVIFEQLIPNPEFIGNILLGNGCSTSTINLNGAVTLSCDMLPNIHNARDIGSAANRLKAVYATDVYTGDLHLKNEHGDWTMVEAEEYLTIRNNKTGKTFRLLMEEV